MQCAESFWLDCVPAWGNIMAYGDWHMYNLIKIVNADKRISFSRRQKEACLINLFPLWRIRHNISSVAPYNVSIILLSDSCFKNNYQIRGSIFCVIGISERTIFICLQRIGWPFCSDRGPFSLVADNGRWYSQCYWELQRLRNSSTGFKLCCGRCTWAKWISIHSCRIF